MPIVLRPDDLSAGDQRSREFDLADLSIEAIRSTNNPLFRLAYSRLQEEFGAKNEMESQTVLGQRFLLDPAKPVNGLSFLYEMLLVRHEQSFAAVRDHTAIVSHHATEPSVVVHLSHLLIDKAFRKTGLGGWMRALPLQTARTAIAAAKINPAAPITLVGEMEFAKVAHPERMIRLRSYEKAGYLKIDPRAIPFLQPDFRDPEAIDLTGGPVPIPMQLIIRRVGREQERSLPAREVRLIVRALYRMYGLAFREADMKPCRAVLDAIPNTDQPIRLLPPTESA